MSLRGITIVVMGVSGSGKSQVGTALALACGVDFVEGDALHPPENIAKMGTGMALTDTDRWPWLDAIAAAIRMQRGHGVVVACSALRRVYRDRLRVADPWLRLIYLRVPRTELDRRMRERDHFMPPSLLDSQLATLEEPGVDEQPIILDAGGDEAATVARVLAGLARGSGP
ncbi:gluconokinase [Rhodanobacter sp. C03]|uniref:gluconokinase n=1 Tax=Rhodanobacter sp. C03 TaxID=1945858 RepID=UPI000985BE5F|nr:gluconokinase [Rhodanobacter sp. C03]OOG57905.1 hypothetical protein B0E48_06495 [Rhodanobacter sp. C03]